MRIDIKNAQVINVNEEIVNGGKIKVQNQQIPSISIKNSSAIIGGEVYKGSYEVIPQIVEQTLETKDKLLKENVEIQPIPYYEVDNLENGKTIIIGGEIKWQ